MEATLTQNREQAQTQDTRMLAEALVALDSARLEEGLWDEVRRGLVKVAVTEDTKTLGDVIALLEKVEDPPDEVKKALKILRDLQETYEKKGKKAEKKAPAASKGEGGVKLPAYGKRLPPYGQQLPSYGESVAEAVSVAKALARAIAALEKEKNPSKNVQRALKALRSAQEAYEKGKAKKAKKAKESLATDLAGFVAPGGNGGAKQAVALESVLKRLDRLENEKKIEEAMHTLDELLNKSDLPSAAQKRVEEQFKAQVRKGQIPTAESIQEAIEHEYEYANELLYHAASSIQGLSSAPKSLKEAVASKASVRQRVLGAFGLTMEEDKSKEE
jgi:hypothetical protein